MRMSSAKRDLYSLADSVKGLIKNMCSVSISSKVLLRILRCLVPASCFAASLIAQDLDQLRTARSSPVLRARAVLGLEGVANNSMGELSIQDDAFVFSRREGPTIRMPLSAIRGAFLSQEDKQVGGIPMAFGRAATPYAGGRVIGLFAHKKYDFVTLEYFDSSGGFHGTIYQLNKGQGQVLADELGAKGVHVSEPEIATAKQRVETNNAK
jgi:hypothetical protein